MENNIRNKRGPYFSYMSPNYVGRARARKKRVKTQNSVIDFF